MCPNLIQATCTFVGLGKKQNAIKQRNKDNWYGRPKSLLSQTFAVTLKTRNETSF
jgi:hypothetical protein